MSPEAPARTWGRHGASIGKALTTKKHLTIALDAMGGDTGPEVVIPGAALCAERHLGGELGVGITEGAALLRAAAGERFWIKPDERVGVFGVDVGEVEGDTGIGGGGCRARSTTVQP